jgi:exonuclease III
MRRAMLRLGGKVLGFAPSPDESSKGVISWVPRDSPIYDLIEEIYVDTNEGRYAIMAVKNEHESLHLVNIYAPADSPTVRDDFFANLQNAHAFDYCDNIIMCGDWNFVSSSKDKMRLDGPSEPSHGQPKAHEFLEYYDQVDVYRHYFPDKLVFSHRHVGGERRSRLDRFYAESSILSNVGPLPPICTLSISDHDAIGIRYGESRGEIKPSFPMYRMSRALIKLLGIHNSRVKTDTEKVLA